MIFSRSHVWLDHICEHIFIDFSSNDAPPTAKTIYFATHHTS
jgi:hypothetical protein